MILSGYASVECVLATTRQLTFDNIVASTDRVSVLLSIILTLSVFEPHGKAEDTLRCQQIFILLENWLFFGMLVGFCLGHWLEYLVPLVVLADKLFLLGIKQIKILFVQRIEELLTFLLV